MSTSEEITESVEPLITRFNTHFRELRQRVLVSMGAVFFFSVLAYIFSEDITRFLMVPLFRAYPDLATLVYTNLTEAFVAYLKVAVLAGVIAAFPVVCYQTWMFIAPGLKKQEKKVAFVVTFCATLLFGAGALFAFFIVLPEALNFLVSFATSELEALPKLDSYLGFVARTSLAFGLAFEIPFLMVAAGKTGLVARQYFTEKRWMFYVAIMVLSFLLTAGDLFSAVLLAFPLVGLYEAGILIMRIFRC